jgi:hypothetical protein
MNQLSGTENQGAKHGLDVRKSAAADKHSSVAVRSEANVRDIFSKIGLHPQKDAQEVSNGDRLVVQAHAD